MKILILSIIGAAMLGTMAGYLAVDIAQDNVSTFGVAPRVCTVRQGCTGQSSFGSSTLLYGNNIGALQGTSSPVVTYIIASSTSATSSFEGGGIIGKGFQLKNYTTCNLDTDANGFIQCGTDATGAAGAWTADQDADGYDLFDLGGITATSGQWLLGTTSPAFSRPFAVQGGGFFAGNLTSANLYATGTINVDGGVFASGTAAYSGLLSLYNGIQSTASSSILNIVDLTATDATTTNATTTALYVSGGLQVTSASSTIVGLDVSDVLQIPNAAGCTTVDALGEICLDDTSNTLNFYEGAAERVLNPKKIFGFTIASTTPFERWALPFTMDYAFTVSEVRAKMSCMATTSPSAAFCAGGYDFNLSHGASQNSTSTLMSENSGQLVNTISTSTMTSHTTFNDAAAAANEQWFFYTMAASSSNDSIIVEVFGFQDP